MQKYTIPENLNGIELRKELNAAGVTISDDLTAVRVYDGELVLEIAASDKVKADTIVAAHNGTTVAPELTIEQKLASVGLNLEDLKSALGL
jgi:hypothetical protein